MPKSAHSRGRQNQALLQAPELLAGQCVGRVVQACGENTYEVDVGSGKETTLYKLPKRLRHVTFVKRDSFVFVRDDDTRGAGKLRGDIEAVVLDHFVSALRKRDYWPHAFREHVGKVEAHTEAEANAGRLSEDGNEAGSAEEEEWEIGMGNPNRHKWSDLYDDSDDDEDSEEEDGDDGQPEAEQVR